MNDAKRAAREAALLAAARKEVAARNAAPRRDETAPAKTPPSPLPAAATVQTVPVPPAAAPVAAAPAVRPDDPAVIAKRIEALMLAEAEAKRALRKKQQIYLVYLPTAIFAALVLWAAAAIWSRI